MRTTVPLALGAEQAGGLAGSAGTAPSGGDFGRLLEARRRDSASTTEARPGGRRRSAVERTERRTPSGDDQVRAGRATARLGGKRTARADRPDRPERPPERPDTNRAEDPAAAPAASAPARAAPPPASDPPQAKDTSAPDTAPVVVECPGPGSGLGSAGADAPSTAAAAANPLPAAAAPSPAPNVPAVAQRSQPLSTDPAATGSDAAPGSATASTTADPSAPTPDGTPVVGSATASTAATGTANASMRVAARAAVDQTAVAAVPLAQMGGDDAGTASDDAPGRETSTAASGPPTRAERHDDPPASPGAPTATPGASTPAATPPTTTPTMSSGAVARAMEAATRADQAPAPLTSRLAVELDDTTRVAVHVHGQTVRVDVIEDPNTRLDASWRRDVAEGIRRHGLEYERQGADANDRRNRRDADDERTTARDGGTRIRRRFAIDLNAATSS